MLLHYMHWASYLFGYYLNGPKSNFRHARFLIYYAYCLQLPCGDEEGKLPMQPAQ